MKLKLKKRLCTFKKTCPRCETDFDFCPEPLSDGDAWKIASADMYCEGCTNDIRKEEKKSDNELSKALI